MVRALLKHFALLHAKYILITSTQAIASWLTERERGQKYWYYYFVQIVTQYTVHYFAQFQTRPR